MGDGGSLPEDPPLFSVFGLFCIVSSLLNDAEHFANPTVSWRVLVFVHMPFGAGI